MVVHIIITVASVFILGALAEGLHARRCRRIRFLAHGPGGGARRWTQGVPVTRVLALGAFCWGLLTLLTVGPRAHAPTELDDKELQRILVVYDVSPSMLIQDAGAQQNMTRRQRSTAVFETVLSHIEPAPVLVTIVAVHTGAKPVIINARDLGAVRNILNNLPLEFAFRPGKTDLLSGISLATQLAALWPRGSTALLVLTDGDTVADIGMPKLPPSIANVRVFGLGNPIGGTFIDGHMSKQDRRVLAQLARRLQGAYRDVNRSPPSAADLAGIGEIHQFSGTGRFGVREIAIVSVVASAAMLSLLPILLSHFGTCWRVKNVTTTGAHA